jgi:hypothetical protein
MGAWPMVENGLRGPCQPASRCTPHAWSPRARPARWHGQRHPAGGRKVVRFSCMAPSATCGGAGQGEPVRGSSDKHDVDASDFLAWHDGGSRWRVVGGGSR